MSIQLYRLADPFGSDVVTRDLVGYGANQLMCVSVIWLYCQNPPIIFLRLGKFSGSMVFEPLLEQAGGGWIGRWIASFGIGAALMAVHRAYCDVRDAVPALIFSYLCCDNRSEILRCRRSSSDRLISTVTSS